MNTALSPELEALVQAVDLTDGELREASTKCAKSVQRQDALWKYQGTAEPVIRRILRKIAKRHHITLPNKETLQQTINRLTDAAWWRRALRPLLSRP